ncbi:hypothetical protein NIES2098_34810 [Calothrix sp. NIES-2098]|nr:hypothetical protein NIES2098_34810 [Calothrix sp. NIES-2098]
MISNFSDIFQVVLIACIASAMLSGGICLTLPRAKKLGYN